MENKSQDEKLDSFSKILLSTHAIIYMANQIHQVNEQLKMVPSKDPILIGCVGKADSFLKETSELLSKMMEDVGEFINDNDIGMPIDSKVMSPIFKIMQGEDNVE